MNASRKIIISARYAREGVNATPILSEAVQQLCLVKNGVLELEKANIIFTTAGHISAIW